MLRGTFQPSPCLRAPSASSLGHLYLGEDVSASSLGGHAGEQELKVCRVYWKHSQCQRPVTPCHAGFLYRCAFL